MPPDKPQSPAKRRLIYLKQDLYVALLAPRLIAHLKIEIQEEFDQNRFSGIGLTDRVLASIDINELEFTDHYDQNVDATYLLVDRFVRVPTSMQGKLAPGANPGHQRPARPTLLHVMGRQAIVPTDVPPRSPTIQLGFWEKFKN